MGVSTAAIAQNPAHASRTAWPTKLNHPDEPAWEQLLPDAGQVKRGLVLVAYESMERARDGKPETLLAAVHNASVWPVALCSEASIAPKVWVRTEDGQPVGLTAEGKRRQTPRLIDFSFSGTGGFIMPGHAIAETYPLGSYFCLNRSGNYTILAASYLLGGKQVLVARPLTVRMRTSSTQPRKSRFEDSRTAPRHAASDRRK